MHSALLSLSQIASLWLAVNLVGCGAPSKSAGDVAYLFEGKVEALQTKVNGLCQALSMRDVAPSTKNMTIDLKGCDAAGMVAVDLKKINAFQFLGLDSAVPPGQPLLHKEVRTQLWLNRSLLGLAQALSTRLGNEQGKNNVGLLDIPNLAGDLQNLANVKLTILEQPHLDVRNLSFSMKIHLKISGIIEAEHDLVIIGKMLNDAFAVTIVTTQDAPFEKSLIQSFQTVILIVPHANDIYLDMFVDLKIYNVGMESLIKSKIDSFLSTGLKSIIDSVFTL